MGGQISKLLRTSYVNTPSQVPLSPAMLFTTPSSAVRPTFPPPIRTTTMGYDGRDNYVESQGHDSAQFARVNKLWNGKSSCQVTPTPHSPPPPKLLSCNLSSILSLPSCAISFHLVQLVKPLNTHPEELGHRRQRGEPPAVRRPTRVNHPQVS